MRGSSWWHSSPFCVIVQPQAKVDKISSCRHGNCEGSHNKEDCPDHCETGRCLHDTLVRGCAGCKSKKTFAPDLKELQRLLGKNSASRAMQTGAHREEACKDALCDERWSQAVLAEDEGKLAAGSRRRATRASCFC